MFPTFCLLKRCQARFLSLRTFEKAAMILAIVCCALSVILAIGFINSGQLSAGNVVFTVCFAEVPAALAVLRAKTWLAWAFQAKG